VLGLAWFPHSSITILRFGSRDDCMLFQLLVLQLHNRIELSMQVPGNLSSHREHPCKHDLQQQWTIIFAKADAEQLPRVQHSIRRKLQPKPTQLQRTVQRRPLINQIPNYARWHAEHCHKVLQSQEKITRLRLLLGNTVRRPAAWFRELLVPWSLKTAP
jgi:hypothetical protein